MQRSLLNDGSQIQFATQFSFLALAAGILLNKDRVQAQLLDAKESRVST
jgi:hypothetical protein